MSNNSPQKRVKVLYQNLNGVWYAFAENGEEVYFGKVPVQASQPVPAEDASPAPEDASTRVKDRAPSKSVA